MIFQKTVKRNALGNGVMKLNLTPNLVLNKVCPVLSLIEHFQPIINVVMYIVIINFFVPHAFNLESQYFIFLYYKISWICGQQTWGDETSNEGCNSSPTSHDFIDKFYWHDFFTKFCHSNFPTFAKWFHKFL